MIIEKINYLMPSVIEADLSALLWQPNTFPGSDTFNQLIVTGFIIFWIGLTGIFFNRRLVISILLAVELTLLSINLYMSFILQKTYIILYTFFVL